MATARADWQRVIVEAKPQQVPHERANPQIPDPGCWRDGRTSLGRSFQRWDSTLATKQEGRLNGLKAKWRGR